MRLYIGFIKKNKKKFLTLALVLLLLINIVSLSFILFDFGVIKSPETTVQVTIKNITLDEIIIESIIKVKNPNSFDISIKDMKISTFSNDGFKIGILEVKGGDIKSGKSRVFKNTDSFAFQGHDFKILKTKIDGNVGVKLFGIFEKKIPLDIKILTSVEKVIDDFKIPQISLDADFVDLNPSGMNFTCEINVVNPNDYKLYLQNVIISVENSYNRLSNIIFKDGAVKPNDISLFRVNGSVSYEALDVGTLFLKLTGVAGIRFGGIEQFLNVSTSASLVIPNISDFIFQGERIDFDLPVQFKVRLRGVESTVGFKIYNPSNIPLLGENLICSIYRLDGENKHLLDEKKMDSCPIGPHNRVCVKTKLLVPYRRFFSSGSGQILPDKIILGIDGDLSIAGTNQSFPVSLEAYVDPNIFNPSDVIFEE